MNVDRVLLACGVAASLLYVAVNILVPLQWPGYSHRSRVVSELSAIGAPTRDLWLVLVTPYGLLLNAFAVGVWRAARGRGALRIAGAALLVDGLVGYFWPPMHMREALAAGQGDLSDTLHIAFTVGWAVLVMVAMLAAAVALGRRFRVFTVASLAVLLVFGILTGTEAPGMSTNAPTPWIGLWERINIGAFVIWLAVFAVALMRRSRDIPPDGDEDVPPLRVGVDVP